MTQANNVLTHAQMYKLARWVEKNIGRLKENRYSYQQAAALATSELGMPITYSNVSSANGMAQTGWRGALGGNTPSGGKMDRSKVIAKELLALLDELDMPASQKLIDIASGQTPRNQAGF